MRIEHWFIGLGVMLLISILGSRLSTKLGVPVLLVFLGIGMLLGSDGPGGIWFEDARLSQDFGVVALAFILFSGGMDLDWRGAKGAVGEALSLSTLGVLVTTLVIGGFACQFLGFSWVEGLLLGSIVASTDAAAVFGTLQRTGLPLNPRLQRILEMESGSNDPAAIFLTLFLVEAALGRTVSPWVGLGTFGLQMAIGGLGGWLVGRLGVVLMRRLRLDFEGMYHGLSIAILLLAFGGTSVLGGNGFLAAYIAGIAFGNGEFRQRKGLRRFHDGIAWLMQIGLFVVLGLLVYPSQLLPVIGSGLLVSAVLIFVARPLGVLFALAPFRTPWREQSFLAWSGLRGAVPIVLATFPLLAGLPRAQEFFNIVFFVVIISAALQGPSMPWLARKLGLVVKNSD